MGANARPRVTPTLLWVAMAERKRVTVHRNGDGTAGKVIMVPMSFSTLLNMCSEKLDVVAKVRRPR